MEIYIVSHFQDNGESYEDRQTWTNRWLFSTWEKAYAFYCNQIIDTYKGTFKLWKVKLDNYIDLDNSGLVLETSPWGGYTYFEPEYDFPEDSEIDEEYCQCDYPEDSIKDYWKYEDSMYSYDSTCISEEEEAVITDWLTHKGENYQIFEEIRKCEEDKLTIELLKDLISLL